MVDDGFIPVKGYEGHYEVNRSGVVRSVDRVIKRKYDHSRKKGKVLSQRKDFDGRYEVGLSVNGISKTKKVHRIVAESFLPNPFNLPEIDHIDGDKTNNHVSNLEWVTPEENRRRAQELKLGNYPKPILQFKDGKFIKWFSSHQTLSKEINRAKRTIMENCRGRSKTCAGYTLVYEEHLLFGLPDLEG